MTVVAGREGNAHSKILLLHKVYHKVVSDKCHGDHMTVVAGREGNAHSKILLLHKVVSVKCHGDHMTAT